MSTSMYAFVEVLEDGAWRVADRSGAEESGSDPIPRNIAPSSWGKFNFAVYYQASGEKGLPEDMSGELAKYVRTHWEWVNRPSWMTMKEMRTFFEKDKPGRYAHLAFEELAGELDASEAEVRVVFWADQ